MLLKESVIETQHDLVSATHLREVFRYIAQTSDLDLTQEGDYISLITNIKEGICNFIVGIGENQREYLPLIDHCKQHNIPFTWFSYPLTPDLNLRLTQQGLNYLAPLTHVTCDLKHPLPQRVQKSYEPFIPVTTASLFQTWCEINAAVWNRSLDITKRFFRGLSPEVNQESRMQLFLARKEKEYVGCSLIDIQGEVAGCYWDCILPNYRKQRIGSQMIYQRQEIAKSLGCSVIVAQCLDSSLGLYLHAGFQKGAPMALYRYCDFPVR